MKEKSWMDVAQSIGGALVGAVTGKIIPTVGQAADDVLKRAEEKVQHLLIFSVKLIVPLLLYGLGGVFLLISLVAYLVSLEWSVHQATLAVGLGIAVVAFLVQLYFRKS